MKSLAGAIFATIQDYPSIAAGSCIFMVAFALVAGNAMLGQPGSHPDPLWATRDRVTTQSVARGAGTVPVRKVRVRSVVPAIIPVPEMRPAIAGDKARQAALVRRTQEMLNRFGLYDGKIDGLYGPVTRNAVLDFQRANGLTADGQLSEGLLQVAATLGGKPAAGTAAPKQAQQARSLAAGTGRAHAPRTIADLARAAQAPERQPVEKASYEMPASADPSGQDVPQTVEDLARAARIARIQIGLMNFGDSGIAVDGVLGPHTVDAIRLFQQRYGLPRTGEPDEAVVRKLEEIGALQSGQT